MEEKITPEFEKNSKNHNDRLEVRINRRRGDKSKSNQTIIQLKKKFNISIPRINRNFSI